MGVSIFRRRELHGLQRADFGFGGNGNVRRFPRRLRAQNHLRERVVFAEAEDGFDGVGDDVRVNAALRRRREARRGIGRAFVALQKDVAGFHAGVAQLREERSREGARRGVGGGVEGARGSRSRAGRDDDRVPAVFDQRGENEAHGAERRYELRVQREADFFRGNGFEALFGKVLSGEDDAGDAFFLLQHRVHGGFDGFGRSRVAGRGNEFVRTESGVGNRSRERAHAHAEIAEPPRDAQRGFAVRSGDDDGIHKKCNCAGTSQRMNSVRSERTMKSSSRLSRVSVNMNPKTERRRKSMARIESTRSNFAQSAS